MVFSVRILWILIIAAIFILPLHSRAEDSGKARKLVNSQGCKACHSLEEDGGTLSVSFEAMRANLSQAEIRTKLTNQDKTHGNRMIYDFSHLTEEEINLLAEFIQPKP